MTPMQAVTRVIVIIVLLVAFILFFIYNARIFEMTFKKENASVKIIKQKQYYILQWTGSKLAPFDAMGKGNSEFIRRKCKYSNCFVTDKTNLLNQSDFDAIAFNGRQVVFLEPHQMPRNRTRKQKYIFVGSESSARFPACNSILDGFFNWTWTYKLDSDFPWLYLKIYDVSGNVVGPATAMEWPREFKPISKDLENKLSTKSKAAVWFASNCYSMNNREGVVKHLKRELKAFGWTVDMYGKCGTLSCPRKNESTCFHLVEKDYYFYLSFENSFSKDYVTEKVLTALNHYAIPVVYGSANYSRFLPPGSYLDARKLSPKELAEKMNKIIHNKTLYYDFFRWRNHFDYISPRDDICKLCEMLNNEQIMLQESVWMNFRSWWNEDRYENTCKMFETLSISKFFIWRPPN